MEFGLVHSSKNIRAQLNYLSPPYKGVANMHWFETLRFMVL